MTSPRRSTRHAGKRKEYHDPDEEEDKACCICYATDQGQRMLLCDGCDEGYHTFCLDPPIKGRIPQGNWYCPSCTAVHQRVLPATQVPVAPTAPQYRTPTVPAVQVVQSGTGEGGEPAVAPDLDEAVQLTVTNMPVVASTAVTRPQPPPPAATNHMMPGRNAQGTCKVCEQTGALRTIACRGCSAPFHATCLGLHASAYPAGEFVCADCTLLASKIPLSSEVATQAAHMLVYLTGHRVACSSMDTYASAMHRFVYFFTHHCGLKVQDVLPPGKDGTVSTQHVTLFLAYAASRYMPSTIRVTLSALVDWHKSKGADHTSVSPTHPDIKNIMQSIQVQQGPEGLPKGKVGMSKEVLFLVLRHVLLKAEKDHANREIYIRDWAMIALGFYGLFRRSELIQLTMADITYMSTPTPHWLVTVRGSKTDQVKRGATVIIASLTKDSLDIGKGINALLEVRRANQASPQDPLLPAWDMDTRRLSKSIRLKDGQALATRLKVYLKDLLVKYPQLPLNPSSYGMHSLRRGGVVAAWNANIDLERIKAHGRWKSNAVHVYMTPDVSIQLSVSSSM